MTLHGVRICLHQIPFRSLSFYFFFLCSTPSHFCSVSLRRYEWLKMEISPLFCHSILHSQSELGPFIGINDALHEIAGTLLHLMPFPLKVTWWRSHHLRFCLLLSRFHFDSYFTVWIVDVLTYAKLTHKK